MPVLEELILSKSTLIVRIRFLIENSVKTCVVFIKNWLCIFHYISGTMDL